MTDPTYATDIIPAFYALFALLIGAPIIWAICDGLRGGRR